jgi:hypothetical protein
MDWFSFEFSAFLWVFVILNIINVVIQTIKSIVTIKCGKGMASVVNALAYGLYTVVVVFMSADGLGLFWKAVIIGLANLIGVYIVKLCEEKARKDRLWKVELTVPTKYLDAVDYDLKAVPHSYIRLSDKHTLFNFYCATQEESRKVKDIANQYDAKYFVAESKTL